LLLGLLADHQGRPAAHHLRSEQPDGAVLAELQPAGGRGADGRSAGAHRVPRAAASVRLRTDPGRQQGMTVTDSHTRNGRNSVAADLPDHAERYRAAMTSL